MGHGFNHYKCNRNAVRATPKALPSRRSGFTREELRAEAERAFKSGVEVTRVSAKPRRDALEANNDAHQRAVARIYGVR
jgi:hypothetical protein